MDFQENKSKNIHNGNELKTMVKSALNKSVSAETIRKTNVNEE